MIRWTLVLVAACANKAAPRVEQPITNTKPVPEEDLGDAIAEGCDDLPQNEVHLRVGGRATTVQLFVCQGPAKSDSEQQRASGAVQHDMVAQLAWFAPGEKPKRQTIREWTNGWEWGGMTSILGVLVGPPGKDGVLAIESSNYDTGYGGDALEIYAFNGKTWTSIAKESGDDAGYQLAKDGSYVFGNLCTFNGQVNPGEICDATTGKQIHVELRWNGSNVERTESPL